MLQARAERAIYWRILTPLLLAVLTLVVVSIGGFHALSGARACVGGESLWSKASNQALTRLRARAVGSPSNTSGPAGSTANDWAAEAARVGVFVWSPGDASHCCSSRPETRPGRHRGQIKLCAI